jgi:hypothetical protein
MIYSFIHRFRGRGNIVKAKCWIPACYVEEVETKLNELYENSEKFQVKPHFVE